MSNVKVLESFDQTPLHICFEERGHDQWLIVTHGLGEHSGRHQYIKELFLHRYNIVFYDCRGHGRSGGARGSIERFADFARDLNFLVEQTRKMFDMKSWVLFGHSMGGLIVSDFLRQEGYSKSGLKGVYLSSPPVAPGGVFQYLTQWTSASFWKWPAALKKEVFLSGMVDPRKLSHDLLVGEKYLKDPDTLKKLSTKLLLGLIHSSQEVFSRPLGITVPGFVSVGSSDQIVSVSALQDYFTRIEKGFYLKTFQNAFHEIHNEVEQFQGPYFEFLQNCLVEQI